MGFILQFISNMQHYCYTTFTDVSIKNITHFLNKDPDHVHCVFLEMKQDLQIFVCQ